MKRRLEDMIKTENEVTTKAARSEPASKKEQILSLYASGVDNLEDIALMTNSRPTYVASVLQGAGLITGYFDLYTTSSQPMNTYSRFFAGKLGFKNEEAARKSVELLEQRHHQFKLARDRAGQHHTLVMGLTIFNRARWTGKWAEANIFRQWLLAHLNEPSLAIVLDNPEEKTSQELSVVKSETLDD
jgi:hypothetical protein